MKTAFSLSLLFLWCASSQAQPPASPDERFGELFREVQMTRVFADSKTFADCAPKREAAAILADYAAQKDGKGFDLKAFVLANFDLPEDRASGFRGDARRSAVAHIDTLWDVLTRQPREASGSLLPLPYPYVVPGGRFREIYYWDSYFTMLGLRASGREDLLRHMVDNFAHLIDTYGHVPNGNRSYYLSRSQPPFFSLMVELLAEKDTAAYVRYLPQLEKEYTFWMAGASQVSPVRKARLRSVFMAPAPRGANRYYDERPAPRPESYREDVELAQKADRRKPERLYADLRSACESGWDFSSRWLSDPQDLSTIRASKIVPVDLNCLLFHLEETLAKANRLAGDKGRAHACSLYAQARKGLVFTQMWDVEREFYFDYDWDEHELSGGFALSGVYPLFVGIASQSQADKVAERLRSSFLKPGGLVTTLEETGQQWDAPNGWAPLQWIAIQGLRRYGHDELAEEIKRRWVALNLKVYQETGKLVEKYDVVNLEARYEDEQYLIVELGKEAGGGEYPLQDGFGWTNGVLRALMAEDGKDKKE